VEGDEDKKGTYILHSEDGKVFKEMKDKKAIGYDQVPQNVLTFLGESGLKIMRELFKSIHKTGEWSKRWIEIAMVVLQKKPNATKCSDHRTVSLIDGDLLDRSSKK
jgi:hypothetical protein